MATLTNLINTSEDLNSRPSSPDIPYALNAFPFEYNRQDDDNFDVPPPTIILVDGILEHYNIPTWRDTAMCRTFYHIWTLLTSWTFVNNYLHILNWEIWVDLITVVNNFINLTQCYCAPHSNQWVTLMIWDNLRWIQMLRGGIYLEETTRITAAGHRICFIEPHHQPALGAGIAWMHASPSVPDAPIIHQLDLICSLTHQRNPTSTRTGWNMSALRRLQSEVNALVWWNDDFHQPNRNHLYQDAAVIAIQAGYSIEGRNIPNHNRSAPAATQFSSTVGHLERNVTWDPSNVTFIGEETAGTMGCYLCGQMHYTSEHQNRGLPWQRNTSPTPPPSYPAAIAAHPITPYEAIPEQPPTRVHPLPTVSTSTAITTRCRTRTRPATPIVEWRNHQPWMMTALNAPHYHPGHLPSPSHNVPLPSVTNAKIVKMKTTTLSMIAILNTTGILKDEYFFIILGENGFCM